MLRYNGRRDVSSVSGPKSVVHIHVGQPGKPLRHHWLLGLQLLPCLCRGSHCSLRLRIAGLGQSLRLIFEHPVLAFFDSMEARVLQQ